MEKYFGNVSIRRCKMSKQNQRKHSLEVTVDGIQSAEVPLIICTLLLQIGEVENCTASRLREGTCTFSLMVCTPIGCDALTLIKGATGPNLQKEIGHQMVTDLTTTINTN